MAVSLLFHDISDLCLGKPAIPSLPSSATVGDALCALKKTGEQYLGVWSCDHGREAAADQAPGDDCRCIGKVCMVDVVVHLCRDENLSDPAAALQAPLSLLLLPDLPGLVRHVEPNCSLLEALDLILEGAQNLVVPIQTRRRKPSKSRHSHANGREFCWITQEDIVRFLLNGIGLFSPVPACSIDSLGIIQPEILAVGYQDAVASAVDLIAVAQAEQTSVAVVAPDGTLIGEISPATVAACGEAAVPAILTLSAGDLMSYIDCGGPPSHLVWAVRARLKEQGLEGMLDLLGEELSTTGTGSGSTSSSDDESPAAGVGSPTGPLLRATRSMRARMARRSEAVVCQRGSSLVAVMIQALAHRVNYVWVVDGGCGLAGIVTFSDVLRVFREHFQAYE